MRNIQQLCVFVQSIGIVHLRAIERYRAPLYYRESASEHNVARFVRVPLCRQLSGLYSGFGVNARKEPVVNN